MAHQDWIGLMIFKNFADQDCIGFNFLGSGLDSDWKTSQSAHLWCTAEQRWAFGLQSSRDEHRSGLDRNVSGLKPIFARSGLNRTAIGLGIGGSGLGRTEKIYCIDVIILTTSKMIVVLRSEVPSGIWAKRRTVATIEFTCHDHSIIACSRHIYVWCCSSHTSRSWWITQSTQHHRRGCNSCNVILQIGWMVIYILPSMAKALLGRFCYASNFVQTPTYSAEFVLLATRWT